MITDNELFNELRNKGINLSDAQMHRPIDANRNYIGPDHETRESLKYGKLKPTTEAMCIEVDKWVRFATRCWCSPCHNSATHFRRWLADGGMRSLHEA